MKRISGIVAGVLLMFVAADANATIPSCFDINVVASFQAEEEFVDPVFTGRIGNARFTTRDLIALLEELLVEDLPPGTCILADPDGGVTLVDRDGEFIEDVSGILEVIFGTEGGDLFHGTFNEDTLAERSRIMFLLQVLIFGGDFEAFLQGVAYEVFSATAVNDDFEQRITGNIRAKVNGEGFIADEEIESYLLLEGVVRLVGSGVFGVL
jgi:hypothetical protein